MADELHKLASELGASFDAAEGIRLRQATVNAIGAGTVDLVLGTNTETGDDNVVSGAHVLAGYVPLAGETVFALHSKTDLLVVGPAGGGAARVSKNANQNISNNSTTTLTWDVEDLDTDGMVDLGTSNTRITIVSTGRYLVTGMGSFVSNATGRRLASLSINGTETLRDERFPVNGGATSMVIPQRTHALTAGDYLELKVFQTSGGTLATAGAGGIPYYFPFLEVRRVR